MDEAMQKDSHPWLAQYDFRTKQNYIFRTNKLQEIVGASALITCMYDLFLDACEKAGFQINRSYTFPAEDQSDGIPVKMNAPGLVWGYRVSRFIDLRYKNAKDEAFTADFTGDTVGKVLYVGGGNLYILWKDKATAIRANSILCRLLREEGYSLFPACGLVPYTGRYLEDIRKLSEAFNRSKEQLPPFEPIAALPFTRFNHKTSFPVSCHEDDEFLPEECWLKRLVSRKRIVVKNENDPLNLRDFEKMRNKGVDSLLAVIHIDGNNMGERVSAFMNAERSREAANGGASGDYSAAVQKIRQFSNTIQKEFVTMPLEKISGWLTEHRKKARIIVAGGDDVTLVCRAKDALEILKQYFASLNETNKQHSPEERLSGYSSACAGVCIFHAHSPFAAAYDIAEACCEEAKKKNRKCGGKNMLADFQYCFSGITGELEDIRKVDSQWMARPYSFNDAELKALEGYDQSHLKEIISIDRLTDINDLFANVSGEENNGQRSVMKRLSSLLLTGQEQEFELEIHRLEASYPAFHAPETSDKTFKRLVFDLAQVYDLWFTKEEERKA